VEILKIGAVDKLGLKKPCQLLTFMSTLVVSAFMKRKINVITCLEIKYFQLTTLVK
jgi:hypothetical protein